MTRGELKGLIQAAGHGTDTDTAQNEAFRATLYEIAGIRRWSWLAGTSTSVTVTAGTSTVAISATDVQFPTAVRLEYGTDYLEPLEYVTSEQLRDWQHEDRDNGVPQYYTWDRGTLQIYPEPDLAYTGTLDYLAVPDEPDDDNYVPPFDVRYHPVLAWGALRWLSFRQRDWNAYNAASAEFTKYVREMEQGEPDGTKPTHVKHWSGWGTPR